MKRYWKLISIVFVTVIVISMFYIQASTASSNYPEFIIKRASGSVEEGKKLSIIGDYSTKGMYLDTVHIDGTETIYPNEIPFLESLNGVNHSADMKKLQRDYRTFMRGKDLYPNLFYEDKTHLAYANIKWDTNKTGPSNFTFTIEILDKDSMDVTVINESMPKQKAYDYALVEDVQKIDDKLIAVVRINTLANQGEETMEEVHVYTFDIHSQALIGDDILASSDSSQKDENEMTSTYVTIIGDSETIEPQKQLLIQKVKQKEVPNRDGFTTEEIDRNYTIYNYETNEQKEISKGNQQLNVEMVFMYSSTIYFMNMTTNGLEIQPYQIDNEKFSTKQMLQLNISEENDLPLVKLKNNKMYVVSPYKDVNTEATILMADLKTWKIGYEGTIEQTNVRENQEDYSLYIHSLDVK